MQLVVSEKSIKVGSYTVYGPGVDPIFEFTSKVGGALAVDTPPCESCFIPVTSFYSTIASEPKVSTFAMSVGGEQYIHTVTRFVCFVPVKSKLSGEVALQSTVNADFDNTASRLVTQDTVAYASLWKGASRVPCTKNLVHESLLNNLPSGFDGMGASRFVTSNAIWKSDSLVRYASKQVCKNLLNNTRSFTQQIKEVWSSTIKREVSSSYIELFFEPIVGQWNSILLLPSDGAVSVVATTEMYGLRVSNDRRSVEGIVAFKSRKQISLTMTKGITICLDINPTYFERIL
jgi:hypothetical protein